MNTSAEQTEYTVNAKSFLVPLVGAVTLLVLWQARSVVLLFITALLLAASLEPIIRFVRRYLPFRLAELIVVLGLFVPLSLAVVVVSSRFIHDAPSLLQAVLRALRDTRLIDPAWEQTIEHAVSFSTLQTVYVISLDKITTLGLGLLALVVMTYATTIGSESLRRGVLALLPSRYHEEAIRAMKSLAQVSGDYIRGNVLISLICGSILYTGLWALGIPYPGQLAVVAAILDLLPLVGAVVVGVPAAVLGLMISPTVSVLAITLFVVYQEAENHILVPIIYNKALSLRPVPVLVVVLIGATIFGTAGAFVALPIAAAIPSLTKLSMVKKLLD